VRLQVATQLPPVVGREILFALARCLGRFLGQRRNLRGQLRYLEVDEGLPRFRIPGGAAVPNHHRFLLGGDANRGQVPSPGKLVPEFPQRALHLPRRELGGQRFGRPEKNQILEGETKLAVRSPAGVEEIRAHELPDPACGKIEKRRRLGGGVPARKRRTRRPRHDF
jgi:hypothetical protein